MGSQSEQCHDKFTPFDCQSYLINVCSVRVSFCLLVVKLSLMLSWFLTPKSLLQLCLCIINKKNKIKQWKLHKRWWTPVLSSCKVWIWIPTRLPRTVALLTFFVLFEYTFTLPIVYHSVLTLVLVQDSLVIRHKRAHSHHRPLSPGGAINHEPLSPRTTI